MRRLRRRPWRPWSLRWTSSFRGTERPPGRRLQSQFSTDAYETAPEDALRLPAGTAGTTWPSFTEHDRSHRPSRLPVGLGQDDVVVTVFEHHANLLPWSRAAHSATSNATKTGRSARVRRRSADRNAHATAADHRRGVQRHGVSTTGGGNHCRCPCRGIPTMVDAARLGSSPRAPADANFMHGAATKCTPPTAPGCLLGLARYSAKGTLSGRWRRGRGGRPGRGGVDHAALGKKRVRPTW